MERKSRDRAWVYGKWVDRVSAGTRAMRKRKGKEKEVVHYNLGSSKKARRTKASTKPRGNPESSDPLSTSPSVE